MYMTHFVQQIVVNHAFQAVYVCNSILKHIYSLFVSKYQVNDPRNLYNMLKKIIIALHLAYEKPTAFALCASVLDLVAFVRFELFKTKSVIQQKTKTAAPISHASNNIVSITRAEYVLYYIQKKNKL
ncbi:hypothetical protein Hanom_Chr01g00069851 [Helianthus anomalus]